MKHISRFLPVFFFLLSTQLFAQRIENVRFTTAGNNIEIYYTVAGLKFNQTLNTSIYASTDGGVSFQGPLKYVTGEFGPGMVNGQHKVIWEATKEIPLDNITLLFDVRAEVVETPVKKNFFVALTGNQITPLGLRLGLLGKTGYYLSFQTNTTPTLSGSYTYKDNAITDYDRFAWYEFTSEHKKAAFAAFGGLTFQAGRNFFFYTGAGYGKYEVLYEIKEYSYEDDALLGTDYGRDETLSVQGPAFEAGIILRTGKVLLMGGANVINFKMPGWSAGVGFSF